MQSLHSSISASSSSSLITDKLIFLLFLLKSAYLFSTTERSVLSKHLQFYSFLQWRRFEPVWISYLSFINDNITLYDFLVYGQNQQDKTATTKVLKCNLSVFCEMQQIFRTKKIKKFRQSVGRRLLWFDSKESAVVPLQSELWCIKICIFGRCQNFSKRLLLWCLLFYLEDADDERRKAEALQTSWPMHPPTLFTNFIEAFKSQNSTFQKVDRYVSTSSNSEFNISKSWRISWNSQSTTLH